MDGADVYQFSECGQTGGPLGGGKDALGGAYLAMKRYDDARSVFKKDLEIHTANGRSLYGLYRALLHIDPPEAEKKKADYEKAWTRADYKMTDAELW